MLVCKKGTIWLIFGCQFGHSTYLGNFLVEVLVKQTISSYLLECFFTWISGANNFFKKHIYINIVLPETRKEKYLKYQTKFPFIKFEFGLIMKKTAAFSKPLDYCWISILHISITGFYSFSWTDFLPWDFLLIKKNWKSKKVTKPNIQLLNWI